MVLGEAPQKGELIDAAQEFAEESGFGMPRRSAREGHPVPHGGNALLHARQFLLHELAQSFTIVEARFGQQFLQNAPHVFGVIQGGFAPHGQPDMGLGTAVLGDCEGERRLSRRFCGR